MRGGDYTGFSGAGFGTYDPLTKTEPLTDMPISKDQFEEFIELETEMPTAYESTRVTVGGILPSERNYPHFGFLCPTGVQHDRFFDARGRKNNPPRATNWK